MAVSSERPTEMNVPTATAWQHSRVPRAATLLALVAVVLLAAAGPASAQSPVTFDAHSVKVNGKRVFLNSGEVHPYRMPAPAEWPEMLAKMRAAGLNTISIYIPWSLHKPAPGRLRFSGRF